MLALFHCDTVEPLQVGFTQTTVAVQEGSVVVLTITLNENAWITEPVTVMYTTNEDTASKFSSYSLEGYSFIVLYSCSW